MDYAALAKQFGAIEAPQQQDWKEGLSPKDRAELQMKAYEDGRKRIADLDAEISRGESVLNDLNRFGQLNRDARTGGVWENLIPNVPLLHGKEENEMISIQNRLAPTMRVQGSGQSSDRDVSLMLSGLPRIENTGDVNKNIRMNFQGRYDMAVKKKQAMLDYLEQNGHLNGFDTQWANSLKAPKQQKQPSAGVKFLGFE